MNTTTNTTLTIFYNDEYVLDKGVETRTKARPIARMITEGEVSGVTLKSPQSVTREQLLQIHDALYLDELWGKDPQFLASILASTGGVLAALDQAMIDGASGTLSSGLHHAQRGADNGLCYLNGLALVVLAAIEKYGLTDVGILDLDAHWGGGTFQSVMSPSAILTHGSHPNHDIISCWSMIPVFILMKSRRHSRISKAFNSWSTTQAWTLLKTAELVACVASLVRSLKSENV